MKRYLNQEFLNFIFLVFLIQISFLTSITQSFYFFLTFTRSLTLSALGFASLFFMGLIALFSEKFRNFYLSLFFNKISIYFVSKLKDLFIFTKENYPRLCFIFFHLYIVFSIFHLCMVCFYYIDVNFEFVYQLLNLVRLVFFPLFLFIVFSTLFPNFFKMEKSLGEGLSKALSEATLQLLDFLKDKGNIKRNKKTAGLIYLATGTSLVAVGHKHNLQEQLATNSKKFGLDFTSVPEFIAHDAEAIMVYKSALKTISEIDQSDLSLLASDVSNFLTSNPTLRQRFSQDLVEVKASQAVFQAKKQRDLDHANDIGISRLAPASTDSEIELSSSLIPKIQSAVETLFFEN